MYGCTPRKCRHEFVVDISSSDTYFNNFSLPLWHFVYTKRPLAGLKIAMSTCTSMRYVKLQYACVTHDEIMIFRGHLSRGAKNLTRDVFTDNLQISITVFGYFMLS